MRPTPPLATYRLQLTPRFGFDAVRRILPYLARLGVDTLYLSPILAARRGSSHGYDGIDPRRVDPQRGGGAGFSRLVAALRRRHLKLVVDFVPNHLAADVENPAWRHLLASGPRSPAAAIFDIDWSRGPGGASAVVLPVLDLPMARAFARGRLAFERRGRRVVLRAGATDLPLSRRSEKSLLAGPRRGRGGPPPRRRLATRLAEVNQGRGSAAGLRARLLEEQWYRLVPWWESARINYRRFFDIAGLVGVRVESDAGFSYLHRWLRRAVRDGRIQGIRLDHIDGLADPLGYLRRLEETVDDAARSGGHASPLLWVEKILGAEETLPAEWPVEGTTGYEALIRLTGVLLPDGAGRTLEAAYRRNCRDTDTEFALVAWRAKRDVEEQLFAPERAALLDRLLRGEHHAPPRSAADDALRVVTAGLDVYRTYARGGRLRPVDRRRLTRAFVVARRREPAIARTAAFAWLVRYLLGPAPTDPAVRAHRTEFLKRWQQWTGAVAAKGIEDTAFYRYVRYVGANEVGGDPGAPATPLDDFHAQMSQRARLAPRALTPLSTHDTKWGEDARARLVALAEAVGAWGQSVARWRARTWSPSAGSARADRPTPREEYRIYQALVASAPIGGVWTDAYQDRLESHIVKAAREARETTSWTRPDLDHEMALRRFVRRIRSDSRVRREIAAWVDRLDHVGGYYSLGQTALQFTVPGIPDLYQGSEGGNHALVDPDNRRPIDFRRLDRLLRRTIERTGAPGPRGTDPTGARKLAAVARLLALRRSRRTVFERGNYEPLVERAPSGKSACIAFARRHRRAWIVTVVGRELTAAIERGQGRPVGPAWAGRSIPLPADAPIVWREWLTGRLVRAARRDRYLELRLPDVFDRLPVAVLVGTGRSAPHPRPVQAVTRRGESAER